MRLIDADKLPHKDLSDGKGLCMVVFSQDIAKAPTIDAEPKTGEWTTEQVAEMLANLFGDECACNWSGIDEWLPLVCKYADTQCPDPKEKHGCWMQFLIQGGWNK